MAGKKKKVAKSEQPKIQVEQTGLPAVTLRATAPGRSSPNGKTIFSFKDYFPELMVDGLLFPPKECVFIRLPKPGYDNPFHLDAMQMIFDDKTGNVWVEVQVSGPPHGGRGPVIFTASDDTQPSGK